MINTVEDARLLAAYTKYPPTGERSWGPAIALGVVSVVASGCPPVTSFAARAAA